MWRDEAYLLDILLAARDAQEFSSGLTKEAFATSKLHQAAIVRALDYTHVDLDRVWEVVTVHVPDLIARIEPLVPPPEDGL
jgi:uncharacterized protein with HEPN domain